MATGLDSRHFTKAWAEHICIETADWINTTPLGLAVQSDRHLSFVIQLAQCAQVHHLIENDLVNVLPLCRADTWVWTGSESWAQIAVHSSDESFTLAKKGRPAILGFITPHRQMTLLAHASSLLEEAESLAVSRWRLKTYFFTGQKKHPSWRTINLIWKFLWYANRVPSR